MRVSWRPARGSRPVRGAQWIEVFQMPAPAEMETIEAFFKDRGAPDPPADKALLPVLHEYRPLELTSVMFLPLAGRAAVAPRRARSARGGRRCSS